MVFEYDDSKYSPTEYQKQGVDQKNNSDAVAKTIIVDGKEKSVAATDVLKVKSNLTNIDLGLVEIKKSELELVKTVSKITVVNNKGTKEYNFNGSKLAKIEIESKQLENSNVQIEYLIRVENIGNITGYVKNIVDYLPPELNFDESLNSNWYKENGYLYNKSLENIPIAVGETKEVKLILTKNMTESSTGLISNIARITEAYNDLEFLDSETKTGSQVIGEDNKEQADVIIGVKTGKIISFILSIMIILILEGVYIFFTKDSLIKNKF